MNRGGSERGRHRIRNRLQALSCQHRARCGARTHGPRDHDLSRSQMPNRLSHPGAPTIFSLNEYNISSHPFFKCLFILRDSKRTHTHTHTHTHTQGHTCKRESRRRGRENSKQTPCCHHRTQRGVPSYEL